MEVGQLSKMGGLIVVSEACIGLFSALVLLGDPFAISAVREGGEGAGKVFAEHHGLFQTSNLQCHGGGVKQQDSDG